MKRILIFGLGFIVLTGCVTPPATQTKVATSVAPPAPPSLVGTINGNVMVAGSNTGTMIQNNRPPPDPNGFYYGIQQIGFAPYPPDLGESGFARFRVARFMGILPPPSEEITFQGLQLLCPDLLRGVTDRTAPTTMVAKGLRCMIKVHK